MKAALVETRAWCQWKPWRFEQPTGTLVLQVHIWNPLRTRIALAALTVANIPIPYSQHMATVSSTAKIHQNDTGNFSDRIVDLRFHSRAGLAEEVATSLC